MRPREHRGDLRIWRSRGGDSLRRVARQRGRPAERGDRSTARPGGVALLERHDGSAEGRDAHPPQPRGQPAADGSGVHGSRARGSPDRNPPVLPHLRNDLRDELQHLPRLHRGDDAALRAGSVSRAARETQDHVRSPGAADRAGPREASRRREARSFGAAGDCLGCGSAQCGPVSSVRRAPGLLGAAGLRAHRDEPGDSREQRRSGEGRAGFRGAVRLQHRVQDRRLGDA